MGLSLDGIWRYQTNSVRVQKGPCTECRSSDAYETYADGHSHCYSCGHHIHPTGAALLKALSEGPKVTLEVTLPRDCDYYIPEAPQAWLDKYSLTMPEIRLNKISWSESKQSLIFPVYPHGGVLALYQARYFGDNPEIPKWKTVGRKDVLHVPSPNTKDSRIVVVEDLVSAMKVGRITNSCPLFGSYISSQLVSLIALKYAEAIVWLDPDANLKAVKTALALGEAGLKVKTIFGHADPKEYWTHDIREMVNK
jgi:hypothetical protein